MILSSIPIRTVDLLGSVLMIILSFLCLGLVRELRRRDRNNVIWIYLLLVCIGFASFAISRSAGHILKQILTIAGRSEVWASIGPFSGAINTMTFIFVASVTLFFERVWRIYRQIETDRQTLQSTRDKLLYLNQNLENLVEERTEALAISEHKFRRIFEVSQDMMLVTRKDGSIVEMNPAGFKMLGYDENQTVLYNKVFAEFFADTTDWSSIQDAIHHSGSVSNLEVQLKHIDDRRIRSLVSANLDKAVTEKGDTIHFLVKDIEQRRMVEEQIAQADKLASIGQLSAGIAHEINNPMGIILGYTQLLLRNEDRESEKYADLKTIEKHVRNCKSIVEGLLNFARTSKPRADVIRIDEALDDVLNFIQQHAGLDNIEINKDYNPAIPQMLLDEKKIKQVLMNLIMNAKHAIGDKGGLSLSTWLNTSGHKVMVRIADTGYGIEKKNLSQIFDPFFTTKPTGEGTGLGLSVSYGIIKNHGGEILVESKVGEGSTFTIVLPVIQPESGL
ncbi:histidine kinase [Alkalispirochaeta odontotermitis]|nr:histidine kinase [Alkalispirochaeta odontotermitis]CAB1078119.1 Signal transduction histidine kinase [Olavius algarvensis Delta 1 endosymbiont]